MQTGPIHRTVAGEIGEVIVANLFLHQTFDLSMTRAPPDLLWCRYADDGLVHYRTEQRSTRP